jgi:hypothetical protein
MPTPPPLDRWRVDGMVGMVSSGSGLRASGRETSNRAMRLVVPAMKCVPGDGQIREAMGRYASVSCLMRRKEARGGGWWWCAAV